MTEDLRLLDGEVGKDLLGTAEDGVKLLRPLELLNVLAHARLGQTTATSANKSAAANTIVHAEPVVPLHSPPEVDGNVRDLAGRAGQVGLQGTDLASKVLGLLLV